MRYGPTIDGVHANYDRFEKILKSNDTNQDFVSRALEQFPEKAETYHILAEYLTDQGDYQKALEYYQIALRFANDNFDKLISLQRIAQIYSKNLGNNKLAIENWQAALAINANLPTVWEDLGSAYFEQEQYDLSVQNLQKAWDFFNTAQLRRRLLAAQNLAAKFHDKPQAQSEILSSLPRDNKQNTSLHLEIANLYYEKNDFKNAYDHYQQAIEGGILNPEIYYFAGRCAHSLGLVDVAKNYYVQYLKLNRDGQKAQWIRENVPELSHL